MMLSCSVKAHIRVLDLMVTAVGLMLMISVIAAASQTALHTTFALQTVGLALLRILLPDHASARRRWRCYGVTLLAMGVLLNAGLAGTGIAYFDLQLIAESPRDDAAPSALADSALQWLAGAVACFMLISVIGQKINVVDKTETCVQNRLSDF